MNKVRRQIDWEDVKQRLRQSQQVLEDAARIDDIHLEAVYGQRAAELAARGSQRTETDTRLRALVVVVGVERYGIELTAVAEVSPLTNWTPVPGAPPELLGVINLHGELHSVLDLSHLLGLPQSPGPVSGYVVLVRQGVLRLGLRVDRVEKVELISPDTLADFDERAAALSAPYLRGVSPGKVIVLDIDKLLTQASL
jgi:purine-binding chemotaxis protein CheW